MSRSTFFREREREKGRSIYVLQCTFPPTDILAIYLQPANDFKSVRIINFRITYRKFFPLPLPPLFHAHLVDSNILKFPMRIAKGFFPQRRQLS